MDNKTFRYVTLTSEISIFIDNKGNKYSIDNGLYHLLFLVKQQYTNLKRSTFDADVKFAIKRSIFGTMNTHDEKKMPLLCSYKHQSYAFSVISF